MQDPLQTKTRNSKKISRYFCLCKYLLSRYIAFFHPFFHLGGEELHTTLSGWKKTLC
jgi:hypothetical protein